MENCSGDCGRNTESIKNTRNRLTLTPPRPQSFATSVRRTLRTKHFIPKQQHRFFLERKGSETAVLRLRAFFYLPADYLFARPA